MTVLGHIKSQGQRFRVERVSIRQVVEGDWLYMGSSLLHVRSVSHFNRHGVPYVSLGYWDGRYPWDHRPATQYVDVAYPDPEGKS